MSRTVQLTSTAVAGAILQVGGSPYTVTNARTLVVPTETTDEQIAALGTFLPTPGATSKPEPFMLTVNGVDTSVETKVPFFTVPAGGGKSAVITGVFGRNSSAEQTTAVYGFGWNADATDVVTNAKFDNLATTNASTSIPLNTAIIVGAPGDVFGIKVTTPDTPTFTVDIFGYYI